MALGVPPRPFLDRPRAGRPPRALVERVARRAGHTRPSPVSHPVRETVCKGRETETARQRMKPPATPKIFTNKGGAAENARRPLGDQRRGRRGCCALEYTPSRRSRPRRSLGTRKHDSRRRVSGPAQSEMRRRPLALGRRKQGQNVLWFGSRQVLLLLPQQLQLQCTHQTLRHPTLHRCRQRCRGQFSLPCASHCKRLCMLSWLR